MTPLGPAACERVTVPVADCPPVTGLGAIVTWLAANGPLREGVSIDDAAATVWTVTGPDVHRLLVDGLGWGLEHYATWVRRTLEDTLLPPQSPA